MPEANRATDGEGETQSGVSPDGRFVLLRRYEEGHGATKGASSSEDGWGIGYAVAYEIHDTQLDKLHVFQKLAGWWWHEDYQRDSGPPALFDEADEITMFPSSANEGTAESFKLAKDSHIAYLHLLGVEPSGSDY